MDPPKHAKKMEGREKQQRAKRLSRGVEDNMMDTVLTMTMRQLDTLMKRSFERMWSWETIIFSRKPTVCTHR